MRYRGGMRFRPLLPAALLAPLALAGDKEWGEKIPFTTDWKAAIKEATNTGRILFIYNGWERAGV